MRKYCLEKNNNIIKIDLDFFHLITFAIIQTARFPRKPQLS